MGSQRRYIQKAQGMQLPYERSYTTKLISRFPACMIFIAIHGPVPSGEASALPGLITDACEMCELILF